MMHQDYVAGRTARSLRFAIHQAVAKAELMFAQTVFRRREERKLSYEELATATGIPGERLEAIEEGDTVSLAEMLWLCHALEISVSVDAQFNLASDSVYELQTITP